MVNFELGKSGFCYTLQCFYFCDIWLQHLIGERHFDVASALNSVYYMVVLFENTKFFTILATNINLRLVPHYSLLSSAIATPCTSIATPLQRRTGLDTKK